MTDTVEILLADPLGRWKGTGVGDLFDNQTLYRKDMKFPVRGEYQFSIKQAMRPVRLKGIQDIGLRLEK
jgi:gliding motility-associated lipoprotein GldH